MILRYSDYQICEEDIEIFHREISKLFHLQEFEMQDCESIYEVSQPIHQVLSVISEFFC